MFQDKNSERIKLEAKKENLEDKIKSSKKQFVQIEQEFEDYTSELKQNNDRMEELVHIKRPETELSIIDITNEIRKVQKINDELIENNSEKNSITQDLSNLKEVLGEKINSDKQSLDDTLSDLQKEKDQ